MSATEAAEVALLQGEGGDILLPPERSPLSRTASMSNLLESLGCEEDTRQQLTSCQMAGTWFTATLLLGTLLVIAFVMLAFPSPYLNGAPNCRSGAAMGVLSANGNDSRRLVVWSGRGQSGTVFHEWLHTLRWVFELLRHAVPCSPMLPRMRPLPGLLSCAAASSTLVCYDRL